MVFSHVFSNSVVGPSAGAARHPDDPKLVETISPVIPGIPTSAAVNTEEHVHGLVDGSGLAPTAAPGAASGQGAVRVLQ